MDTPSDFLQRLSPDFYLRTDVVQVARDLLGKVLVTRFDNRLTTGRITEVEAYRAPDDRASHAWGNRRTKRTEIMFREGGQAYIYLCYGIHHMFNVVTGPEGMAHAVLIRAIEPLEGADVMRGRLGHSTAHGGRIGVGPGALSKALGITTAWTGQTFFDPGTPFWIEDRGFRVPDSDIARGPRIGIDYAGECAAWEWRFWLRDSKFVKR